MVSSLPSGTVTFVFTDIEASTRLWEGNPAAMQLSLARHDEIVRRGLERAGGSVFSTGGDGFAVAFQRASDAVTAAVAVQRALRDEVWPNGLRLSVRIGVHTGESEERGGDYFGQPVNRAARVMSAANGGQILVSGTTAQLLAGAAGFELVDLGRRRLKGVTEEIQVFGVRADDLAWIERPLVTDQAVPGNLARFATEYVGRVDLLKRRAEGLAERRLVTLTGPGGVGKTRAASEVGWLSVEWFPGGVWFVELAAVSDPGAVVAAVAATLSVQPQPDMSLAGAIVDWLHDRRLLLILDNCEHVIAPVAELVTAIVGGCPSVTVLVTSREPINVAGERVVPVASLALAEAEELFELRATAADESLAFSDGDRQLIAAICERLDGIPLAIELAAARARSLSLADLQSKLDDRFRVLRGGGRGGLERHQTLRATVAWSYQLLDEQEQGLFDRVTVFAGGFDLAAAEAVCGEESLDPDDVVDLLGSLVDKSMVVADRSGGVLRYRLLETLRQYGEERLQDHGGSATVRDRHLRHFLRLAHAARALQCGPRQMEGHRFFEQEWANLRAGHEWAVITDDRDAQEDLVQATFLYAWQYMPGEHADWAHRLLDRAAEGTLLRSSTYLAAATWAMMAIDFDRVLTLGRAGIERDTAPVDVAVCGYLVATALLAVGHFVEAGEALDAAERAAVASPDPYGMYWVLNGWVQVTSDQGLDTANAAADRLSEFARRTGAPWMMIGALVLEAWVAFEMDDIARAADVFRQALAEAVSTRMVAWEQLAAAGLVITSLSGGAVTDECVRLMARVYDTRYWYAVWQCVENIAAHLARRGHVDSAATLLGHLDEHVNPWSQSLGRLRVDTVELVRAHPETAQLERRGADMGRDDIVAFALGALRRELL